MMFAIASSLGGKKADPIIKGAPEPPDKKLGKREMEVDDEGD